MITQKKHLYFLTDKSEAYEFYYPLKKALMETKEMIQSQLAHVGKVVEVCSTKYGECTQIKVQKKKKEQNKKKGNKKQKLEETVEVN